MSGTKPKTYFVRPSYVYLSLGLIVVIHIIACLVNTPAFAQLIINSLTCVYIGCMSSSKIKINKEKNKLEKVIDENNQEKMTNKDAAMFPVYLSGYLFGLYMLFKIIDPRIVSFLLSTFFSLMGVLCLMEIIEDVIEKFFPPHFSTEYIVSKKPKFHYIFGVKEFDLQLTRLNFISLTISLFPMIVYTITKNWITNNLFGVAFSCAGIASFTVLPNFKVGMLMLWGLFFYDIFWVYGTDVMITVAKSIDAPIKLMFPYNWFEVPAKFSMLGLGDIVIPGVFVSLCLKYDIDRQISSTKKMGDFKIDYFHWCFAGYTLGMIATFATMVIFNHPQPALLFLVPGCTLSVLLKAVVDGKLKEFLAYEQDHPKEGENKTQ